MNIFSDSIEKFIANEIIKAFAQGHRLAATEALSRLFDILYKNIPDKDRLSHGEVYIIRELSKNIHPKLIYGSAEIYQCGEYFFKNSEDFHVQGIGLNILSFYGVQAPDKVFHFFEIAAKSDRWHLREYAQMFFKKIIKKHPNKSHDFLLEKVKSDSPLIRRFVAETLRPVQENRWLYKEIDYSLSILKHLFKEKDAYPRTAVGNNLSDISKQLPEMVLEIVKELIASNDSNSYWIGYRACRNLIKQNPIAVMDILQIDRYKYKSKIYFRHDYQRDQS